MRSSSLRPNVEYAVRIPHGPKYVKITERARLLTNHGDGWVTVETLSAIGIPGPKYNIHVRDVVRPWNEAEVILLEFAGFNLPDIGRLPGEVIDALVKVGRELSRLRRIERDVVLDEQSDWVSVDE